MSKPKIDLPRQLQRQQEEMDKYDKDMADAALAASNPPADPPAAQDGQEPPAPVEAPVSAEPAICTPSFSDCIIRPPAIPPMAAIPAPFIAIPLFARPVLASLPPNPD